MIASVLDSTTDMVCRDSRTICTTSQAQRVISAAQNAAKPAWIGTDQNVSGSKGAHLRRKIPRRGATERDGYAHRPSGQSAAVAGAAEGSSGAAAGGGAEGGPSMA